MSAAPKRKAIEIIDCDADLDDFQLPKKPRIETKPRIQLAEIKSDPIKKEEYISVNTNGVPGPVPSTQSQFVSVCLVCDRPLYHLTVQEREQHVIACLDQSGVWDDDLPHEIDETERADVTTNTNVTPVTAASRVAEPLALVRATVATVQSKITAWFTPPRSRPALTRATSATPPLTRTNSTPPLTRVTQPLTRSDTTVARAETSTTPAPVRQTCPFYKRVPHTPIIVDGFACQYVEPASPVYFLSHFHADHYKGLGPNFTRGPIYCSQITANLLLTRLRVKAAYIHVLPMRTEVAVPNLPRVTVQLFDANHCPGAVLMLFKLPDGTYHLHSGDFRYNAELEDHRALRQFKIHNLYLDTTYCTPKYVFPSQSTVISQVIDIFSAALKDQQTLVLIGTYTIGKEKFFLSLASIFECKIYVNKSKMQVLKCLELEPQLLKLFTCQEDQASVHIVPLWGLNIQKLEALLQQHRTRYRRIVAFRPTGWSFKGGPESQAPTPSHNKSRTVATYAVPYSEHSSFAELRQCVQDWRPQWIIPTVNNYKREQVDEMVRLLRHS